MQARIQPALNRRCIHVLRLAGLILFAPTIAASAGAKGSNPPAGTLPGADAFAQWLLEHRSSDRAFSADPATLERGLDLARQRASEMRAMMEKDPEQFVHRAMPETDRAQLPRQLQDLVERRVKARGFFGVYCALPGSEQEADHAQGHRPGIAREVRLDGATYQAFTFGRWKDQMTVLDAAIEGVVLEDAIAIGDSPTPTDQIAGGQQVTEYTPTTTGPNTLLYIIARFSDQTSDPISEATALPQVTVVSNFWMNNSGGTVSLRGLVHPDQACDFVHITLPHPASYASTYNSSFGQLLSDARSAASAQGYNYSSYNLDVVVTTGSGFGYAGRSYIGAQGSHWVAGYTSLRTAGHELGHNLGLWHANYWRTDSILPFGKDSVPGGYVADQTRGEWIEYGHYFSVMSAQFGGEWDDATKPHYNPAEKIALGWLTGSEAQYVSASGMYRLFRHDARDTVGTPRAIRIEPPATDYTGYGHRYWLQYRYAPWSAAQNWIRNGLEIDVAQTSYGSDGSILLDMSPYSKDQSSPFYNPSSPPGSWWTIDNSDKIDGTLVVGRTYSDTAAGIHITPVATGNNGANEEFVDVVVNFGTFPGNHPAGVLSLSATTNRVATGQPITFTVSATDPDGDALAYAWDFDEVQVWIGSGLNSPSATKSWSAPGQYRVVATVSDMKGGVATASQLITVGSPANTNQIWGRVLWGGQPVYGTRVWTTVGSTTYQVWTEADGSYVLTDLAATNTCTVNCLQTGLTFTPQFSNPLSLRSGNIYGADFYANESLPAGGGGRFFALSGQVTDPVRGAAGVEVRAGGMVTATDAAGYYQLTNLPNGGYTVTPANGTWSFNPASRSVVINSADSTGNNFARVATGSISGTITGIPASSQSPAPTVCLSTGRSVVATKAGSGGNRYWAYTINNVPAGLYSVSAELAGYSITPSGFANPLSLAGSTSSVNFVGTANASIAGAISGRITLYGSPLLGATVSALQGASTIGSAQTDSDGYYRIGNLPSGSYTLSVAKSGCSFSPASISIASVPSSGNNFTASSSTAPPAISSLVANPAVVPGPSATTVLGALASGLGPLTYSWAATAAAGPVAFSANDSTGASSSAVSFQVPGLYTFRCRATDANGFTAVKSVSVTVSAEPGTLAVAPYEVQVAAGQAVAFRADAWDQLGNRITVSPTWSTSCGGNINSTGLFSATIAGGPYQVVAAASGLSATGLVWVTSSAVLPPPVFQAIVPANGNVTLTWSAIPGATYRVQFTANPGGPGWESVAPDVVANGNNASLTLPMAGNQRFYRLLRLQ